MPLRIRIDLYYYPWGSSRAAQVLVVVIVIVILILILIGSCRASLSILHPLRLRLCRAGSIRVHLGSSSAWIPPRLPLACLPAWRQFLNPYVPEVNRLILHLYPDMAHSASSSSLSHADVAFAPEHASRSGLRCYRSVGGCCSATGNQTTNTVSGPSVLSNSRFPPCARMISRDRLRPRPTPSTRLLREGSAR